MEDKFETYGIGEGFVAESGGGVTIEQILSTLRILYLGGVKIDEKITKHVETDPGPIRYFSIDRRKIRPGYEATTLRQVWESLKQNRLERITYEIALRWFLSSPTSHLYGRRSGGHENSGRITVFPPNPIEINGKPQIMVIMKSGDGPAIYLFDARLDEPIRGDYLTADEINPTPYCH